MPRDREELTWLGICSTASNVGQPSDNGVAERVVRTLKEQRLYLHDFGTLEGAREVIGKFIERHNRGWLFEIFGNRTPAEVRQQLMRRAAG